MNHDIRVEQLVIRNLDAQAVWEECRVDFMQTDLCTRILVDDEIVWDSWGYHK